ncbi:MAG: YfhO family protein, partial [Clostridia bacterium]|nr:YfhO family protein [Clostridia bacterium]
MEKTLKSACEEIKTESESKQNKFKEFLKTSGGLVFAPLIVFVLYFIQLIFNGVYPFGNGDYTVVSYDLSAQICPFIEHLFDVLDGESSLFYTYKLAGGTDVFGTFAYFFISPFSFIFLLFGDGNVYNAAGIVMALKLAFVAFSGTLFVKKLFKNIPTLIGGAVGVTYAFCGYTFVSNTYINWTDFLIWLPLCVLAFVRFDKTGKFWAFSTTMALCVYTCFSIACFAMLTVFPVLVSYVFICKKKEERTPFIAYLSLSFAFALILALPVLLPSLASFLGAGRGGTLFENFWFGKTDSGFSNKEFYDVSSTAWYRKFSYILSDGLFVALTVLYFVKSGLKTPISKFMLTAGLFTMLPVVVDESMILLNMGSYMSYALRFGFLNALYFTAGGCLALDGLFAESKEQKGKLNEIENEKEKAELLNGTKNKNKSVWIYFSVCLAVAILLSVFLATDLYVTVWEYVFKDSAMVSDTKNFSSMFAHSLGGLQTVAVIFVSMAIVTLTGWLFVKHKKIGVWTVSLLLFAVNLVPTVFYSEQIVVGNLSTHYNMDHYKTMV